MRIAAKGKAHCFLHCAQIGLGFRKCILGAAYRSAQAVDDMMVAILRIDRDERRRRQSCCSPPLMLAVVAIEDKPMDMRWRIELDRAQALRPLPGHSAGALCVIVCSSRSMRKALAATKKFGHPSRKLGGWLRAAGPGPGPGPGPGLILRDPHPMQRGKSQPLGSDRLPLFGRQNDVVAVLAIQRIQSLLDALAGSSIWFRYSNACMALAQARKNIGLGKQRHTSRGVPLQLKIADLNFRRASYASIFKYDLRCGGRLWESSQEAARLLLNTPFRGRSSLCLGQDARITYVYSSRRLADGV